MLSTASGNACFRLGSSRYPAKDGRGASLYGGRWNHKGTPVIYTAENRAFCALEVLANADELADDYVVTPITIARPAFTTFHFSGPEPFYFDDQLGRAWLKKV